MKHIFCPRPIILVAAAALFSLFAGNWASAQTYCVPEFSLGNSAGDYVNSVTLNTLSVVNGANALPPDYFILHPTSSFSTTLSTDAQYVIAMQAGDFSGSNGLAAWIDFNQDGDFLDAGEKLGETPNLTAFAYAVIPFTVPAGALSGQTRLRVREVYATWNIDPCVSYMFGETEDFEITIDDLPPCSGLPTAGVSAQSSIASVNTGSTFLLSTTNAPTYATAMIYQWQVNDGTGWINIGPTPNMPNLSAATPTSPVTLVSGQTDTAQFRLIVECTNSGLSDTTIPIIVDWLPIDYCGTTVMAYPASDSLGGFSPNTVQFNASNLSMSGEFQWDFGDGTTENGWAWTAHTYAQSGSYDVCVIYTDSFYFCSDTTCVSVAIDSFATVTGTVFLDENQNGIRDAGEPGIANQQISNPYGAWTNYAYSDANGDYTTYVVPGSVDLTYNIGAYMMGGWAITTPNPLTVVADSANTVYGGNDFGVYVDSGYTDYGIDLWCWNTVPGFVSSANMTVQNYGFTANTVTVLLHYDSLLSYSTDSTNWWSWWGGGMPPVSVDSVNNVITFMFTMLPGETVYLSSGLLCPVGTALGTPVNNWATVSAGGGTDGYASNDTAMCQQEVVGSYDPNDKQVNPAGQGPLHAINPNHVDELTYTIRFQNTGTFMATKVLVTDTLDANALDVSSVRLIAHSHPCVLEVVEGNVLKMHFDNIMLPDSFSNEPASHGFFTFGIELLPGLPDGSLIANTAAIYFDFNEPIITNTSFVTLDENLSVHELIVDNEYAVYPNPVDKLLSIVYTGNGRLGEMYSVTDITGRTLLTGAFDLSGKTAIDASQFTNGVYCVQVKSENGSVTKKFTVLHP